MPSITGTEIVGDAFSMLNVYLPGESPSNNDGQLALRFLNNMLSGWAQKALMIPVIAREVFDLTSNKGGPSNPYTIGTGGNLNTAKPANQNSVQGAALLLTTPTPNVEVGLDLYTDSTYASITIKELASAQPTGLYYNPTYATSGFGTINLWPVPDNATNDLVLYLQKPLTQFADLSTTYYVPDGVPEMLIYNLSDRLQVPFGKNLSERASQVAVNSLGTFKRSNTKLFDMTNDFTSGRAGLYNVQTGNY